MSKILAIIIIALIATIGIYYFLISEKNRAVNLNLEMLDVKISGISIIGEKYQIHGNVVLSISYSIVNHSGKKVRLKIDSIEIYADMLNLGKYKIDRSFMLNSRDKTKNITILMTLNEDASKNIAIKYLGAKLFRKKFLIKVKTVYELKTSILGIIEINQVQEKIYSKVFP